MNDEFLEFLPGPYERRAMKIVARFCDATFLADTAKWRFIEYFGEPPTLTPKDIIEAIIQAQEEAAREAHA